MITDYSQQHNSKNNNNTPHLAEPLTSREVEVIYLLFNFDLDASEIAQKLSITKPTVNSHIANIVSKLGASGRADAVCRYARINADYRAAFTLHLNPCYNPSPTK